VSNGWLDDHVQIRSLPSLSMLATPPWPAATGKPAVGIIAANDLHYIEGDEAVTRTFLPNATRIKRNSMTRDAVLNALAETPFTILSGHAAHSLTEGAGLALGDGILTAELVERLPQRVRDVAILSSCSSGGTALDLADESIGLPNALLHAGFRGVHATLWPTADRTAFITLTRLLQLRQVKPEQAPHLQLRDVRQWLRTTTTRQLNEWFTDLTDRVPALAKHDLAAGFREWLGRFHPDATPLEDPADWAAFTYIGR
jgi:CHAT domain-containing protein